MTSNLITPRHVLITGAGGNLGAKAVEVFERAEWCERVTALHSPRRPAPAPRGKVTAINADLTDPLGTWRHSLRNVDAIVHFAAMNPVPESDWCDAVASADMTYNLGLAALSAGVPRFVNCSSNHAMGGYKDAPLAESVRNGELHEELPPAPGTKWHNGNTGIDSTPYGASKVMAERFFAMLAAQSAGRLTAVSMRIGWALSGENDPTDISVSGSPTGKGATRAMGAEEARTLRWFRNMWLSNGDFERLVIAAVRADAAAWPSPAIIVNGVSDNTGTDWSLQAVKDYLGYVPQDDLYALIPPEKE